MNRNRVYFLHITVQSCNFSMKSSILPSTYFAANFQSVEQGVPEMLWEERKLGQLLSLVRIEQPRKHMQDQTIHDNKTISKLHSNTPNTSASFDRKSGPVADGTPEAIQWHGLCKQFGAKQCNSSGRPDLQTDRLRPTPKASPKILTRSCWGTLTHADADHDHRNVEKMQFLTK